MVPRATASARSDAATLRGRLTFTVMLTILLVLGGAVLLVRGVSALYETRASQQRAQARLDEFSTYLSTRENGLVMRAQNYSEWDEFYDFSARNARPPDEWLSSELADWLPLRSNVRTMLWIGPDGRPIWSMGKGPDVARLRALVAAAGDRGDLRGSLAFEEGPALAVVVPVTGFPVKPTAGHFAIAEPLGREVATEFAALSHVSSITIGPLPRSAPIVVASGSPRSAHFRGVRAVPVNGSLRISAEMLGWAGEPVGSVVIVDPVSTAPEPAYSQLLVALGTIGLALAAALAVSLTTEHLVRRPVDRLVQYVSDVGMRTVDGAPYQPIEIDEEVPVELRSMLEVVDGLTERLAERQAELRDALARTEKLEEWFRTVVDESPEGKVLFVDGVVRVANPAAVLQMHIPAEAIVGMRAEDGMGGRPLPLADSDESLTLAEVIDRAASDGRPVTIVLSHPGRETRWVEIAASSVPDSGAVLVSSRDVTDERRREELRGEILDLVSHDLKSPLAVISGYVDILERHPDGEVAEKAIAGSRDAVGRMAEMLEDLLATAKADEFLAPRTMALVRLDLLAEDVAEALRPIVRQEIVVVSCCETSCRGEERRLRQVLTNLIGNAAKYSPDDSPIRVTVECAGERTRIIVEDEGPGIPPAERERVFERFARLETADAPVGFGLGLYIVRAIVDGHGGHVGIEDTLSGKGARLVVDLPLARARRPG